MVSVRTDAATEQLAYGCDTPSGDPLPICESLSSLGIEARPAWKPMHQQPVFAQNEMVHGEGIADALFASGICLPSGSTLSDDDVDRVIASVHSVLGRA